MLLIICDGIPGKEITFKPRGIDYKHDELVVRCYHLGWRFTPFDFIGKCSSDVYATIMDSFVRGRALPKDFCLSVNVWPREHGRNLYNARLVDVD